MVQSNLTFNFIPPVPQSIYANNTEVSNYSPALEYEVFTELSPLVVIPYNTDILANLNLWNGSFVAIFLFGTKKFLQRNVCNIVCLLQ